MDSRVAASPAIAARSNPTSPCTDANRSSTRANASAGSSPASGSRYSSSSIILSLSAQSAIVTDRSEEHTSELQSLMRISYAVFCLKKKKNQQHTVRHQLEITQ